MMKAAARGSAAKSWRPSAADAAGGSRLLFSIRALKHRICDRADRECGRPHRLTDGVPQPGNEATVTACRARYGAVSVRRQREIDEELAAAGDPESRRRSCDKMMNVARPRGHAEDALDVMNTVR